MPVETITRLTIKGYKSIRELNDFEMRPFNVLIGANGSGKSNFIEFFQMLNFMFSTSEGRLQSFAARKGRANSLLHYGAKTTTNILSKIVLGDNRNSGEYAFALAWRAPDDLYVDDEWSDYTDRSVHEDAIRQWLGGGREESAVREKTNSGPRYDAEGIGGRLKRIQVYHFHDTTERAGIRVSQDLGRADRLLEGAENLAVLLYNLKTHKPACYKRILSTVQLVAPFIRDLALEPEAANGRFIILRWIDRSGETYGPHQLSDGTLRAIALIAALLQPDEMMPSILIFDEPELGLHPSAVRLIADLLNDASEKRQVIVATQSPLLIRDYVPADVVVVERSEDESGRGESTFSRLDKKRLDGWLEELRAEFGDQRVAMDGLGRLIADVDGLEGV
jgi:predicted ATPase